MVQLKGIDIDMKDDNGRTILMNMVAEQEDFNESVVDYIQDFVEKYKANPKLKDNDGKSILHFLAYPKGVVRKKRERKEVEKQLKKINYLTKYFLDKGNSSLVPDNDGCIPLTTCFEAEFLLEETTEDTSTHFKSTDLNTRNFDLMNLHLEEMKQNYLSMEILDVKRIIERILNKFTRNIELNGIEQWKKIYLHIKDFFNFIQNNKMIQSLRSFNLVDDKSDNLSIFGNLCNQYTNSGSSKELSENDSKWSTFCEVVELFIEDFSPAFNVKINEGTKDEKHFSALLNFASFNKDSFKAFQMVLYKNDEVDVTNAKGETPLLLMIRNQRLEQVKSLVSRGADVNRPRIYKNSGIDRKILPIQEALAVKNYDIMKHILENGASIDTFGVTGNSLIHKSVEYCAKEKTRHNLRIVSLLLQSNKSLINLKAEYGMNLMHTAVDAGRDDVDLSLDLESLLIRSGVDVNCLDDFNRTPLHYAFTTVDRKDILLQCDPIQIVSILVEAMDDNSIHQKDIYGCSALHYATQRGATVCSLLLLQKGAYIEDIDNLGNTPLANAVHGRHNSCSLMLIQNNANINVMIHNKNDEIPEENPTLLYRYLPEHWSQQSAKTQGHKSVFEGIIDNNWLGLTYIALNKLEKFGFSIVKAIDVAFKLEKFQFAKTLLKKVVDNKKLQEYLPSGRNLMGSFAYYCKKTIDQELIEDIFIILDEAGVSVDSKDFHRGFGSLHSSALLKNEKLVELILSKNSVAVNLKDNVGRTPIDAYFWVYQRDTINEENKNRILDKMFESKADFNRVLVCKPLSILQKGYKYKFINNDFYEADYLSEGTETATALMIATAHKDLKMIQYLVAHGANVNVVDYAGRSPFMLALKTNDQEIIDFYLKQENLDVTCLDKLGNSILDHAIAFEPNNKETFTFDNEVTVNKLVKLFKSNQSIKSILGRGLQLATKVDATKSAAIIAKYTKTTHVRTNNIPKKIAMNNDFRHIFDYKEDSKAMMKIKEEELLRKSKKEDKIVVPKGCTVKQGSIYEGYDILLSKVDVKYSWHGMYNFYRLQIWKEEHKELYILFTNWGRIDRYSHGQYQNTPFSTQNEAIEEFCKVFKAKTGNDWSAKDQFENKENKYRIVQIEHSKKVKRPSFPINLMTNVECQLPIGLQIFLKDISNVDLLKKAYMKENLCDLASFPFEQISCEAVKKAEAVLKQISDCISKIEFIRNIKNGEEKRELEKYKLSTKIFQLNNEYYSLVPSSGFEYEKVQIIENEYRVKEEERRLKYLQEFGTAKSILLGAMLRKNVIHPFDYIFSCLDCQIVEISDESQEAQLIQQYMYNSRGLTSQRIQNIFKIQREEDIEKFTKVCKNSNRRLLWHGTDVCNLISILRNSLTVDAPFAQRTGRSYGDGVYFADVFDKSKSYCRGDYMLLCDVDLGSVKVHIFNF